MAKNKLTDEQKVEIIAAYVECQNINKVAKMFNLAWITVKKVIDADKDCEKKLELKKYENIEDMKTFMDLRKYKVMQIMDMCLDDLLENDGQKIKKSRGTEITTMFGTLNDKYIDIPNMGEVIKAGNLLEAISKQAKNMYDEDKNDKGVE